MLHRSEPLTLSDPLSFEGAPALFDPSPEWFLPGLKPFLGEEEADESDEDDLGFRALLDEPEALARAWRATDSTRPRNRHRRRSRSRWIKSEGKCRRVYADHPAREGL